MSLPLSESSSSLADSLSQSSLLELRDQLITVAQALVLSTNKAGITLHTPTFSIQIYIRGQSHRTDRLNLNIIPEAALPPKERPGTSHGPRHEVKP